MMRSLVTAARSLRSLSYRCYSVHKVGLPLHIRQDGAKKDKARGMSVSVDPSDFEQVKARKERDDARLWRALREAGTPAAVDKVLSEMKAFSVRPSTKEEAESLIDGYLAVGDWLFATAQYRNMDRALKTGDNALFAKVLGALCRGGKHEEAVDFFCENVDNVKFFFARDEFREFVKSAPVVLERMDRIVSELRMRDFYWERVQRAIAAALVERYSEDSVAMFRWRDKALWHALAELLLETKRLKMAVVVLAEMAKHGVHPQTWLVHRAVDLSMETSGDVQTKSLQQRALNIALARPSAVGDLLFYYRVTGDSAREAVVAAHLRKAHTGRHSRGSSAAQGVYEEMVICALHMNRYDLAIEFFIELVQDYKTAPTEAMIRAFVRYHKDLQFKSKLKNHDLESYKKHQALSYWWREKLVLYGAFGCRPEGEEELASEEPKAKKYVKLLNLETLFYKFPVRIEPVEANEADLYRMEIDPKLDHKSITMNALYNLVASSQLKAQYEDLGLPLKVLLFHPDVYNILNNPNNIKTLYSNNELKPLYMRSLVLVNEILYSLVRLDDPTLVQQCIAYMREHDIGILREMPVQSSQIYFKYYEESHYFQKDDSVQTIVDQIKSYLSQQPLSPQTALAGPNKKFIGFLLLRKK